MIFKVIDLIKTNWNSYFPDIKYPASVTPLLVNHYKNIMFLIFKDTDKYPFVQVKISSDEQFILTCQKEISAIKELSTNNSCRIFFSEELRILFSDYIDGYYVHVRTYSPGESLQKQLFLTGPLKESELLKITELIYCLNTSTKDKSEYYKFEDNYFDKYINSSITKYKLLYKDSVSEHKFLDEFQNTWKNCNLEQFKLVFEHGDPNPANFIFYKNNYSIIDWSQSNLNGFPLFDIISFIIWYSTIVYPEKIQSKSLSNSLGNKIYETTATKSLLDKLFFQDNIQSNVFKTIILKYCSLSGLNKKHIKFLFLVFAIERPLKEMIQLFIEKPGYFNIDK